jgi:hypothetical protein
MSRLAEALPLTTTNVLFSSVDTTCFGRVGLPQALKYMILKTHIKKQGYILKFVSSHKLFTRYFIVLATRNLK